MSSKSKDKQKLLECVIIISTVLTLYDVLLYNIAVFEKLARAHKHLIALRLILLSILMTLGNGGGR